MSRFTKALFALALVGSVAQAQTLPNIGRPATAKEIAAWDIDVRPDFKGLPKGSGSVAAGMAVWEGKCASCHGTFGESNEVFTPIIGGTTAEDVKTGRVAALASNRQPQRTTMMKVATVSTLWDYVNRAMPWTAPKSLSTDEVYSVVAYMLNMAEVVPDDFTLTGKEYRGSAEAHAEPEWHDYRARLVGGEGQARCEERGLHEGLPADRDPFHAARCIA
jgi:mono/diheme cytochrome c family protein